MAICPCGTHCVLLFFCLTRPWLSWDSSYLASAERLLPKSVTWRLAVVFCGRAESIRATDCTALNVSREMIPTLSPRVSQSLPHTFISRDLVMNLSEGGAASGDHPLETRGF